LLNVLLQIANKLGLSKKKYATIEQLLEAVVSMQYTAVSTLN
jgi:hypothetical protein